jgi:hypothetical protein
VDAGLRTRDSPRSFSPARSLLAALPCQPVFRGELRSDCSQSHALPDLRRQGGKSTIFPLDFGVLWIPGLRMDPDPQPESSPLRQQTRRCDDHLAIHQPTQRAGGRNLLLRFGLPPGVLDQGLHPTGQRTPPSIGEFSSSTRSPTALISPWRSSLWAFSGSPTGSNSMP